MRKRREHVQMTKDWIDHSVVLGAPCIRVFAGPIPEGVSEEQAFGWALAVPVLWVSTLVYPVMGLAYVLALGAIDTVGHVARRWRAHRGT